MRSLIKRIVHELWRLNKKVREEDEIIDTFVDDEKAERREREKK